MTLKAASANEDATSRTRASVQAVCWLKGKHVALFAPQRFDDYSIMDGNSRLYRSGGKERIGIPHTEYIKMTGDDVDLGFRT